MENSPAPVTPDQPAQYRLPPQDLPSSPESPDPNDPHTSQRSLHESMPVLQYRKPGWRLRTFDFESKVREYPTMKMRIVSFVQIGFGLICLGFSVAVIAVGAWGYQIGTGIWGGALFTLAGGIGLVAYLSFKLSFIVATFVLSTASFVVAFVLFVITCVGIEQDSHHLNILMSEDSYGSRLRIHGLQSQIDQHKLRLVFNGILLCMGVLELGVSMAHALLNARHFFVWDPGCTSESEYVYTNPGAEIEPDLPPTYQEVMGTTLTTNARNVSDYTHHTDYGEEPAEAQMARMRAPNTSRYPNMNSRTLSPDSIEMKPCTEWDSHRYPRAGGESRAVSDMRYEDRYGRPPQYAQPPSYNDQHLFRHAERSPHYDDTRDGKPSDIDTPAPGLRLGRGHPQGAHLFQEPMYRRPNRASATDPEPIYANIQDCTRPRPSTEYEPASIDQRLRYTRPHNDPGAPPRPPYPHIHDSRGVEGREPIIDDRYRPHPDLGLPHHDGPEHYDLDVESHM